MPSNTPTAHWRMGYNGEWDGYDRAFHRLWATSHAEMAQLQRGAQQARSEINAENADRVVQETIAMPRGI